MMKIFKYLIVLVFMFTFIGCNECEHDFEDGKCILCDEPHNCVFNEGKCECGKTIEIKYNVKFVDYDDSILKEVEVIKNENAVAPEDPKRNEYDFIGWDKDFSNITSDIVIKAQYKEHIHEYNDGLCYCGDVKTFNINFGDNNVEVKYGDKLQKPIDPYKEGYIFNGWYIDDNYSIAFDFNQPINSDIQLYAKFIELVKPTKIVIKPSVKNETMYVGYQLKLESSIYPKDASNEVEWELHSSSLSKASLQENGSIKALSSGKIQVRAISKHYPDVKSEYYTITIINEPEVLSVPSLNGYQIVIMGPDNSLNEIDPFLEDYVNPDKEAKQKAWNEVETKYNCDIVVKKYLDNPLWGSKIKYHLFYNDTEAACDIAYINNNRISDLSSEDLLYDLTECYEKYHLNTMSTNSIDMLSYKGKIYGSSVNPYKYMKEISMTNGLFYNYGWLKELGVESPAKLFNEGKWNYTGFTNWVLDVKSKLSENEYVLGGHPYYYYTGMTAAAGEELANVNTLNINIINDRSKYASELIYDLVSKGAVNENVTWAESSDIDNSFWRNDGGTLMVPGYEWFVNQNGRWDKDIWGEDTTEFGYVPFPYPDDLTKEETRLYNDNELTYAFTNGRKYPNEISNNIQTNIWYIIQETLYLTKSYITEEEVKESLKEQLLKDYADENSVEALLYFYDLPTIYDPTIKLYSLSSASIIKNPAINTFYKGYDFDEQFNSIYEKIKNDFESFYGNK